MKIGWYFSAIQWHNSPPPMRGQENADFVEAQLDKCADAGIYMPGVNHRVREPSREQGSYAWLREKCDERNMNAALKMSPDLVDDHLKWTFAEWEAEGFDVDWLAAKFAPFAFLNDLGFEYMYLGHEMSEKWKRSERVLYNRAWVQTCPDLRGNMYMGGFKVPLQRIDLPDRTDGNHSTPQPWGDYLVAGTEECPILSWWAGETQPSYIANGRSRMLYTSGAGFLDTLADKVAWPFADPPYQSNLAPPQKYCHINVHEADKRKDIYQHLEWLNEQMGADDVVLLRTLSGATGDGHIEPWDDLFRLVKHFTDHH